jgi:hypothetical protein
MEVLDELSAWIIAFKHLKDWEKGERKWVISHNAMIGGYTVSLYRSRDIFVGSWRGLTVPEAVEIATQNAKGKYE